jgi:sigma-B regulation protein RsbU (phosphoserine phosphatase)
MTDATANDHPITVLLVDDQAIVGKAVERMFTGEADIRFLHCSDPSKALPMANEITPTVILQDLVMPDIDGLTLVRFFRRNPATREVPIVVLSTKEEPTVKAQAFAVGANDYIVKLPDRLEMLARVRYHSKGYIAQIERNEAYRRLEESQRQLAEEVSQAARYVQSLLPTPLSAGPVLADWKFVPSTMLAGDTFGYHWIDDEHFAFYLLDVSGHGVGAALLAVSVLNVLRSQALPRTDFHDPSAVLEALNLAFPMEKQDGKYFTIWYGVYHKTMRKLRYSGGGHPPALLFTGPKPKQEKLEELKVGGPAVGMWGEEAMGMFDTGEATIDASGRLFLFSDGVFEINRADTDTMWPFKEFVAFMSSLPANEKAPMDRIHEHVRKLRGSETLDDDFSMLRLRFA